MEQDEKVRLSWDEIAAMVAQLAEDVTGEYDVLLAITRGGLIPAGLLAYHLRLRDILVAAVQFYGDDGRRGAAPTFLQFPADPLLHGRRVLVVDEVWDSGRTIQAVTERIVQAGGRPTTAVLHWKPDRSEVAARPDHHVSRTSSWIVYPWSPAA
jgi:hypothetical protein